MIAAIYARDEILDAARQLEARIAESLVGLARLRAAIERIETESAAASVGVRALLGDAGRRDQVRGNTWPR